MALNETLSAARQRLLAARLPAGHWEGELSSSALSTATAAWALAAVDPAAHDGLVRRALTWLAANQNADGGWGDSVLSHSNIATTLLCWSAFAAAGSGDHDRAVAAAERWLSARAGGLEPRRLAAAVTERYGSDRTFSAPILTMAALAGRLGGQEAWRLVAQLPFELAACPHRWLKRLRLRVVSYALPALVAIGQLRHDRRPTRHPFLRVLRSLTRRKTLALLADIQPAGGGFLEAAPLTSFVVMSLAGLGQARGDVARRGAAFLARSVRADGSWPIDTNLSTWVTTLAVNALAVGGERPARLPQPDRAALVEWLLAQQYRAEHPYTRAAPGGWAWTDLSGGVPDADDAAGALLALRNLSPGGSAVRAAAADGARWLLDLANPDGGIPTFCRGWGKLAFDRSAPDLTAHALLAISRWTDDLPDRLARRARAGAAAAEAFLADAQRGDGAWTPLWFGNQSAPREENPTYGTARVLSALLALGRPVYGMVENAVCWLLSAQNADGGWGGAPGAPSSIEETALAVDALAQAPPAAAAEAVRRGVAWLIEHTDRGRAFPPAPIGLYFARLWYFERLYPLIFTVSALGRAARMPGL